MMVVSVLVTMAMACLLFPVTVGQDECLSGEAGAGCVACMEAHPLCLWCYDKDSPRCGTAESLTGCTQTVNVSNTINKPKDEATFEGNPDLDQPARQIRPQKVTLSMRPGSTQRVSVEVRLARDYPVDLYYLMDLSDSMKDDKDNVASLGAALASGLRDITRDVRLGFGSFVDKVAMPYVNMAKLDNPCMEQCEPAYGFRNALSLTDNVTAFTETVRLTPVSGNLDGPEGGFDAMMQALACREQIQWRKKSRKMLVFSTDDDYHSAGDGKLGGIVEPNDGACHLVNNEYDYSTRQDYPSVSHLSQTVRQGQVNVIFAVTSAQVPRYSNLAALFEGSVVGNLTENSDNVVDLVVDNYRKISEEIVMTTEGSVEAEGAPNTDPSLPSYSLYSACLGTAQDYKATSTCAGVKPGSMVTFDLDVKAGVCGSEEGDLVREFTIGPQNLDDRLTIRVTTQCSCQCDDKVDASEDCSGVGTYECGRCSCNQQHFGNTCQCDRANSTSGDTVLVSQCDFKGQECSGPDNGACVCDSCECSCLKGVPVTPSCPRYSGKFCQCNTVTGCERSCSGAGICRCDEATGEHTCLCNAGEYGSYTGKACECAPPDTCYGEKGLCSGRSEVCRCGVCQGCREGPDGEVYGGSACEICTDCPNVCFDLKACAECMTSSSESMEDTPDQTCESKCAKYANYTYTTAYELPPSDDATSRCIGYKTANNCDFDFVYDPIERTVVTRTDCGEAIAWWIIVLALVGGIVVLGLLILLIWKVVTSLHDRREYQKWEEDRKNAQWEQVENPIFEQATTRFKNPTYAGKKPSSSS